MLPVDFGQPHSEDSQAHIPEQEFRRLAQCTGGGERHDPRNAMALHGVEDVSNPDRKDGRRIPGCASQRTENGILACDRAINRGRIEDIAPHDLHTAVDNGQPGRIPDERSDLVTSLHGSIRNPSARLTGGSEHNDLHEARTPP